MTYNPLVPTYPADVKDCEHPADRDWSTDIFGYERVDHWFCLNCGRHIFRGNYYTPQEWFEYINDPFHPDSHNKHEAQLTGAVKLEDR